MASVNENKRAVSEILPAYLLDEFIDWIVNNMEVEDVFPESTLVQWAKDNDWIKLDDVEVEN